MDDTTKIQEFSYPEFPNCKHFLRLLPLNLLLLNGALLGIYLGQYEFETAIIGCVFIAVLNYQAWMFVTRLRNLNPISVNLENETLHTNGTTFTKDEIVSIHFSGPFDTPDKRPKFELKLLNKESISVYQILKGYEKFFIILSNWGIAGVEKGLPIYDRVNEHGIHIDDKAREINRFGKPVKVVKQNAV